MMNQQIVGVAAIDELPVVARQRLQPVICRFDEDLRFIAGPTEHPLNGEHLVTDRVAVPERREYLMDADHAHLPACPDRVEEAGPELAEGACPEPVEG